MGNIYTFRGKAATGKSTLANILAKKLHIPVIRKDDIVDALKSSKNISKSSINNEVCYNILRKIIQTNIDLEIDLILDIGLNDMDYAIQFYDSLEFENSQMLGFMTVCSNNDEWLRRHEERLENPLLHQSFKSIEHIINHYEKLDLRPFEHEHIIDTAISIENSFEQLINIINI